MFCYNCGKEISESMRFCPGCGIAVENNQLPKNAKPAGGNPAANIGQETGMLVNPRVTAKGNFDKIQEMTDKDMQRAKSLKIIGWILAALWTFLTLRGVFRDLGNWIERSASGWTLVLDISIMVFFGCIILSVFCNICIPIWERKKALNAQEYLSYIYAEDAISLKQAAERMNCVTVKSVYMDENNNVCIQAKRYKHTFRMDKGLLTLSSSKTNYKASLEQESIALNLLKTLAPQAPVNAYESEKRNHRLSLINRTMTIVTIISILAIVALELNPALLKGYDKYISIIREGYPSLYPDITYGEAFDDFFTGCEWEYFESTDGQDVVEFHGNCILDGKETKVAMQFTVSLDTQTGELYAMSLDREVQTELAQTILLAGIFEEYSGSLDSLDSMFLESDLLSNDENDESNYGIEVEESTLADTSQEVGTGEENIGMIAYNSDLRFPILVNAQEYKGSQYPVMVSMDKDGIALVADGYEDMLWYCVDDGVTMYAPPSMRDGLIYTEFEWDTPFDDWYNGPITRAEFLEMVDIIAGMYAEGVSQFDSTVTCDDILTYEGGWESNGTPLSISIYTDFGCARCYADIGIWSIGDVYGTVYLLGKADDVVLLICESQDGSILYLGGQADGTIRVLDGEDFVIPDQTIFNCVERYEH